MREEKEVKFELSEEQFILMKDFILSIDKVSFFQILDPRLIDVHDEFFDFQNELLSKEKISLRYRRSEWGNSITIKTDEKIANDGIFRRIEWNMKENEEGLIKTADLIQMFITSNPANIKPDSFARLCEMMNLFTILEIRQIRLFFQVFSIRSNKIFALGSLDRFFYPLISEKEFFELELELVSKGFERDLYSLINIIKNKFPEIYFSKESKLAKGIRLKKKIS